MSDLIDWELASRLADAVAGEDPESEPAGDLERAAADSERAVRRYTGLQPVGPVPASEWVTRRQWAQINLESLRRSMRGLEEALQGRASLPGFAESAVRGTFGRLAATQIGGLAGLASKRVLGPVRVPAAR